METSHTRPVWSNKDTRRRKAHKDTNQRPLTPSKRNGTEARTHLAHKEHQVDHRWRETQRDANHRPLTPSKRNGTEEKPHLVHKEHQVDQRRWKAQKDANHRPPTPSKRNRTEAKPRLAHKEHQTDHKHGGETPQHGRRNTHGPTPLATASTHRTGRRDKNQETTKIPSIKPTEVSREQKERERRRSVRMRRQKQNPAEGKELRTPKHPSQQQRTAGQPNGESKELRRGAASQAKQFRNLEVNHQYTKIHLKTSRA